MKALDRVRKFYKVNFNPVYLAAKVYEWFSKINKSSIFYRLLIADQKKLKRLLQKTILLLESLH